MQTDSDKMIFENREAAGLLLADELKKRKLHEPLILALPRGGVSLAKTVAQALQTSVDILLVRKIGAPFNKELALGAVVEGEPPRAFYNQELIRVLKIEKSYLDDELQTQVAEIERRKKLFRQGRALPSLRDRTVVVIDDGIATGASVRAALQVVRSQNPSKLLLAVPVAPADLISELEREVDDFVCLLKPIDFVAVGKFYRDFRRITDDEVQALLKLP